MGLGEAGGTWRGEFLCRSLVATTSRNPCFALDHDGSNRTTAFEDLLASPQRRNVNMGVCPLIGSDDAA